MQGNSIVFKGNLTKDPSELASTKFGPSTSISVAHNYKTREGAEKVTFATFMVNGPLAVNVFNSLRKGDAVDVTGSLTNFQDKDNPKRTLLGLVAETVAADLTFASITDIEKMVNYDRAAYTSQADEDEEDDEPAPRTRRTATSTRKAAAPVDEEDDDAF